MVTQVMLILNDRTMELLMLKTKLYHIYIDAVCVIFLV